jgi:threonine/homoserine/homoserine lactone efflux protein
VTGLPLGDLLPMAVGIALSPLPVAAVILMLFSAKARSNGVAFIIGWVAGLAIVGAAVLAFGGAAGTATAPSTLSIVIQLLLGLLLLVAAARQWRASRKVAGEPEVPKWMRTIDDFSASKSFAHGAALSGVNPKNLALNVAAMAALAQAGVPPPQQWLTFAAFLLLASVTVALPVAYFLVGGDSSKANLTSMKTWLISHNAIVTAVVLLILGMKLLGTGLQGLLDM